MDRLDAFAKIPDKKPRGRRRDPVFVFMVAAMVLAIIGSVTLRMIVPGYGPKSGQAADLPGDPDMPVLTELPKAGQPSHTTAPKPVNRAVASQ